MGMKERHTTAVFVLSDRLLVSLKLTTTVDWKRSSNCNIIVSRIEYFYSNAMRMITIQLRTKMKILTKHVVKPYFYNVIFWNMKYFFFFNCQLLLLYCV